MGDPKYPRRVWRKPKRPLNYDLKMDELNTLGTFGLRTKRELWKAHTELSRVRHQARSLLALRAEDRAKKEPILMRSLVKIGLVSSDSTLDDVLNLKVNDLLARRFQTIVTKKFGFKTPYQARQAVIHGHMMIGQRKVDIPSYVVTVEEEGSIKFAPESKIPDHLKKNNAETDTSTAITSDSVKDENATDSKGDDNSTDAAKPADDTVAPAPEQAVQAEPATESSTAAEPDTQTGNNTDAVAPKVSAETTTA